MTIEVQLDRIANALEVIAASVSQPIYSGAETEVVISDKAPEEKSYAETRKAEIKEENAAKKRGRPAGSPNKAKEVAAVVVEEKPPVVEEEDPFADTPAEPEKEITVDELRKTLVALRTKVGKDKAYALLREFGNGASHLPGSTAGKEAGGAGELKPEHFAAVVREANKAIAA